MINNFIPSDPSSLHSVYCKYFKVSHNIASLLRIPDINTNVYHDIQLFLEDTNSHLVENHHNSQEIKRSKDKILSSIKKDWEKYGNKEDMTELEFADKIHSDNYAIIEEEIKLRNSHLTYLRFVFRQILEIEEEIEYYKKDFQKAITMDKYVSKSNSSGYSVKFSQLKQAYDNLFSNYQFGCANPELENFSSINTDLKYARKIFSKSNRAIASKELFENLTNEQKKELKSFHRVSFSK